MTWVDLTTVDDYHQAHILAQALEGEGIPCIEANATSATMLPYLRQGIQIRVKAADFLRAKVISERIESNFKRE